MWNLLNKTYLFCPISSNLKRNVKMKFFSSLVRATASIDEEVFKSIENDQVKPKRHPGILDHGPFNLPINVKKSISNIIQDSHKKQLIEDSMKFRKFLTSKDVPVEQANLQEKIKQIEAEVNLSFNVNVEELSEDEFKRYKDAKNVKVKEILKQRVYNWNRIVFNEYLCLLYLYTRSAAEYAAILKVLTEIKSRSSFNPTSIFDFGSGVGTVIWASNHIWDSTISEYYCVDSSSHMINLSEQILKASYSDQVTKRVFYRQFLPSSSERSYDITVCAYSLLEQPSSTARLEIVKNLWRKTGKYLVIIEFGTKAGFKVLNEARDFLLSKGCKEETGDHGIHIFAPCPHDSPCPRAGSYVNICSFPASFHCFPQKPESRKFEIFSYVVFEKGNKESNDKSWPRIVQPVLQRSRHVICRFCSSSGCIKEVVFTPTKHGKVTYKCAKASRWGDLFPCSLIENKTDTSDSNEANKEL